MINLIKQLIVAIFMMLSLLIISFTVQAESFHMRYNDIYNREILNANYDKIAIGHYFYEKGTTSPCPITKSWMENEHNSEALKISAEGKVQLPMDEGLKEINPDLIILSNKECILSIEIRATLEPKNIINVVDLKQIVIQMNALMKKLVGPMSWYSPKIKGVVIQFSLESGLKSEFIVVDEHNQNDIKLKQNFYKITPWVEKDK